MFVGVALMALPALAQTFGTQQAEQPNAVFQSTSTMTGSGSTYSANPTLNTDGTATYEGAANTPAKGPNRAKMSDWGDGGLGGDPNGPGNPIGDAVLPLLLMSLAFCALIYLRRRKTVKG